MKLRLGRRVGPLAISQSVPDTDYASQQCPCLSYVKLKPAALSSYQGQRKTKAGVPDELERAILV